MTLREAVAGAASDDGRSERERALRELEAAVQERRDALDQALQKDLAYRELVLKAHAAGATWKKIGDLTGYSPEHVRGYQQTYLLDPKFQRFIRIQ